MSKLSGDDSFDPKSFIIFCLDDNGDIGLDLSWGDSHADIKKFAQMISSCTSGKLNEAILEYVKLQSEKISNGQKKYTIFKKEFGAKNGSTSDLVVDPTDVELN